MKKRQFTTGTVVVALTIALVGSWVYLTQSPSRRGSLNEPKSTITSIPPETEPASTAPTQISGDGSSIPISPMQVARVKNIRAETVKESLENLGNYDDMQFAMTSMGDRFFGAGEPISVNHAIPRLYRVRKILEEAQQHREEVISLVRATLRKALLDWPAAYASERALWDKSPLGFTKSEPTQHDVLRIQAEAATYILATLEDWQSLPLLVESHLKQKEWVDAIPVDKYFSIPQCPVPPPVSLFAIHELIVVYPTSHLSKAAQQAQAEYLDWAAKHIPSAKTFEGVKSTSLRDESDPVNLILDPEKKLTESEPKLTLAEFPSQFIDGSQMLRFDEAPYFTPEAEEWFAVVMKFVNSMK